MYKEILLGCLLGIFMWGCSGGQSETSNAASTVEEPAEAPNIVITVKGVNPTKVYLIAHENDQNYPVDSTVMDQNGQSVFQRNEPYPTGHFYFLIPDQSYFQLLIDKDQTFSMATSVNNMVGGMQVNGSLDNELLYRSLQYDMNMQAEYQAISQALQQGQSSLTFGEIKQKREKIDSDRKAFLQSIFDQHPDAFFTKFKLAGQNPDLHEFPVPDGTTNNELFAYLYRTQFWDNVDFNDNRLLRTPVIFNKLKRYMTELTVQQPDSIKNAATFLINKVLDKPAYFQFFANWIALNFEPTKTQLMDSEAVYVHMVQNYFTYDRAFWADSAQVYALQLRAQEMAASLVGLKGPNVTAPDPNGVQKSIYDLKEPYVIVFLYNPECDHCIEETPKLVNYYNQRRGRVGVYAIAVDTDDQKWKSFIRQNRMDWVNVFDPSNQSIYAKYYVDNTPEIYVLNQDRTIIGKNLKVHQIDEIIQGN